MRENERIAQKITEDARMGAPWGRFTPAQMWDIEGIIRREIAKALDAKDAALTAPASAERGDEVERLREAFTKACLRYVRHRADYSEVLDAHADLTRAERARRAKGRGGAGAGGVEE